MASPALTSGSRGPTGRPRAVIALLVLLGAQFVGVGLLFPFYAFARQEAVALRAFAVILALLGVATIVGVWRQRSWALWAALTLTACKLIVDLFNWSLALERTSLPLSTLINGAIIVLAFQLASAGGAQVTRPYRIFYGCVLALAAFVGYWGLVAPARVDTALPFPVPPLHARFLGAMYLSGVVFMILGIRAREWSEARVVTAMIAIWTGALGLVSLLHLSLFDWTRGQVWIWFLAYSVYPILAAWIAWRQRAVTAPLPGPPLAVALRSYLLLQGGVVTLLSLSLLLAAPVMVRIWPWTIPLALAHIYFAPFLSFGLGSLYAARQHGWIEVRIVVYGTLAFTLGVLIASFHHRALFHFSAPAAWLWFGGFGLASLALALFGTIPALRNAPHTVSRATVSPLATESGSLAGR